MSTLSISMALLMGFTGSLHCAGMCGPIVWVMPFQLLQGYKKWLGIGLYHLGRASVYALMGVVLFSFRDIFKPQVQQYVSIILGGSLLIAGIIAFFPNNKVQIALPWANFVKKQLGHFMGRPSLSSLIVTGALNGMLPCGLVYMALSASLNTSSNVQAALFMYAFGLGTMPMLVTLTVLKTRASFLRFNHVKKMVPLMMFAFGFIFMLRGMNLGIPYLSPKVAVEHNEIKASCCHKK